MSQDQAESVVEVHGLSRRFGRTLALDYVDLKIPRGAVFGLVGENGAGKTTLIKHLLGLLRAQAGTVRVFGRDPVLDPVGVLGRVGYLSEDRDLPDWMTISELLRYLRAFYPGWDDGFATELRERFDLRPAGAGSRACRRGSERGRPCWRRWRTGPNYSSWMSPRRAWIRLSAVRSWRPSSGRSPRKAARCSSRRTCWTRSSGWPTGWR